MVAGIDKFRECFVAHDDQYAIIGGAACDLLFDSAGLRIFRSWSSRPRPDDSLDPTAFGVPFSRSEAINLLRSAYGLP